MKFLTRTLLILALGCSAARAADKIEASLYLGENAAPAPLARIAPPDLHSRLTQVFGFHHYQLLKHERIVLNRAKPQWFVPRHDFSICLKSRPPPAGEPQFVDYEIYQEGFIVARGKYEPSEGTPFFIAGPDFKGGRLILVLEDL
jgi:hypothetical protein